MMIINRDVFQFNDSVKAIVGTPYALENFLASNPKVTFEYTVYDEVHCLNGKEGDLAFCWKKDLNDGIYENNTDICFGYDINHAFVPLVRETSFIIKISLPKYSNNELYISSMGGKTIWINKDLDISNLDCLTNSYQLPEDEYKFDIQERKLLSMIL